MKGRSRQVSCLKLLDGEKKRAKVTLGVIVRERLGYSEGSGCHRLEGISV